METNPKSLQKQHGHKPYQTQQRKGINKEKAFQIYKYKPKYHSQTNP